MIPTIVWQDDQVVMIDQRKLPPDVDFNDFGTATATVYGELDLPLRDTWWIEELEGRQGVWNVGGSMGFEIPNDPEPRPFKWIRCRSALA